MRLSLSEAIAQATDPKVIAYLSALTGSGHMASMRWITEIPLAKRTDNAGKRAYKIVHVVRKARAGVEYKNLAQNADVETGPLADWQEYELYPFILRHKQNGTRYARVFISSDMNECRTTYFIVDSTGERECDRADLQALMTPGKWREMTEKDDDFPPTLTLSKKIEEILEVNGIAI